MFSVSTSVVLLVFFVSQAPGQNSSTVSPTVNLTVSLTVSPSVSLSSSQIVSLRPSSAVVSSNSVLGTPSSGPTTSSSTAPTDPITTKDKQPTAPPSDKTCAELDVVIYKNSTSSKCQNVSDAFSLALEQLYKDFAKSKYVKVSEVQCTEKEANLFETSAKLCLVFNGRDGVFIEDVFKKKVGTGKLDTDLPVIKDSAEFKPLGVSFKDDWKAKEGECEKKCEKGTGGPFLIMKGECEPETGFSCDGHKEPTKETQECATYCSSTAVAVSSLLLVIGIFLSSSFQ